MKLPKLLIVEDHRALALALSAAGERLGFSAIAVPNLAQAKKEIERGEPQAILLDLGLPDGKGFDLLDAYGDKTPPPTAMLTAHGEIDNAIIAKKSGIAEFFVKPVDFGELEKFLHRALDVAEEAEESHGFSVSFVGNAPCMRPVFQQIAQACASQQPVMICGASGTGRSHVARLIHQHLDGEGSCEVVSCADVQGDTDWQEIISRAKGGCVVLDNIDQLALESQVALTDCVSVGSGVKWISIAPETGLRDAVQAHSFHPDLYYRLQGVEINLPTLKDRLEDLPALCSLFLADIAPTKTIELDKEFLSILQSQTWKTNLRELKNVMRYAVISSNGRDKLLPEDLPENYTAHVSESSKKSRTPIQEALENWLQGWFENGNPHYKDMHDALEKDLLELLLERYEGNQALMARTLDMNRATLRKKLKQQG
ncbi:regulatory protein AtoC [Rubritalea halochordaticola]|uniref:DNA-binding transcriptional regulator NtrC n=1 Tax=Rubritalea halochordaticola TaxID=714537 RepID=A0ABP9V1G9_9BACT